MSYLKVQELAKKYADDREKVTAEQKQINNLFKTFRTELREIYLFHEDESYALKALGYNEAHRKTFNDLFDGIMELVKQYDTQNNFVQENYLKTLEVMKFLESKSRLIELLNLDLKRFAASNTTPVELKLKLNAPEREGNKLHIISLDRLKNLINRMRQTMVLVNTLMPQAVEINDEPKPRNPESANMPTVRPPRFQ